MRPAAAPGARRALSGAQDARARSTSCWKRRPTWPIRAPRWRGRKCAGQTHPQVPRARTCAAPSWACAGLLDLDGAKRDLAAAKVVAPLAGTVLALNVEPGEQGSGGQAVATLADTSRLNLIVNVEQTDVPHIAPGQEVTIVLYALPDQVYKGEVERIAPGVTDTKQSPSPSPSP
ncbi:MAG: HlyD family efflux transporter periplasmic adaptor subunit [Caldilineaceae bacterium]